MRLRVLLMAAFAVTAALPVATVQSHHSFAMYDGSVYRVFTGVVTRVNPDANHLQIFFVPMNDERNGVIRNEDGEPISWAVEMAGSAQSAREGITSDTFRPGTIFSVGMHPLRSGRNAGDRGRSALYRCPERTPPPPGKHCWDIEGSERHGGGEIPEEGELEQEYTPD